MITERTLIVKQVYDPILEQWITVRSEVIASKEEKEP